MQHSPFFSVLVPTYNQAEYLGEALDSLIAQTCLNWEAIVINDGSTDSTPEVLEAYCRRDGRFRVIHKENGGVASALNVGIQQVRGKWICWLSSDDLFDRRKLEIHLEWIVTHPACHFFFTHFRALDGTTRKISNPPLWRAIPDLEWQVLEMLRGNYVHGNSICVHRDAWAKAGMFNEELRYGQDYDMWLRLQALYPATFIPERTCITRLHALRDSTSFSKARFFDSAKAAITFLNQHSFAELVPFIDLSNSRTARKALLQALDVAADPSGFLYTLGPHPALLLRIMEWAWGDNTQEIPGTIQQIIRRRADKASRQYQRTAFGFFWKAAAVASRLPQPKFDYRPLSPAAVAGAYYSLLKATDSTQEEQLHRYIERFENRSLLKEAPATPGKAKILELWEHSFQSETQRAEAHKWARSALLREKTGSDGLDIIEPMPVKTHRRWELVKHRLRKIESTLYGQPVTRWLSLLKGLWVKRQQRRQTK